LHDKTCQKVENTYLKFAMFPDKTGVV